MQNTKTISRKMIITFIVVCVVALLFAISSCAPQESEEPSPDSSTEQKDSSKDEDKDETTKVDIDFSMESDCVTCHKKAMESEEDPLTVASVHAQQSDMSCITCHNQEKELTEVHDKATSLTEPIRLKTAKISEDTCLSCHGSYEELAEKTAGVTILTDANGLTINPHSAKHLNATHEEDITCMKCHTEHVEKNDQKSQDYCMNCHHMKVYECNTCHEVD